MRRNRAILGAAAGALFSGLLLIPATPAAADGNPVNPPADCTATYVNQYTTALTCTNRPAGQHWQSYRDCTGVWLDSAAFGNVVTGNGTSTAVCPARAHADPYVGFVAL